MLKPKQCKAHSPTKHWCLTCKQQQETTITERIDWTEEFAN